MMIHRLVPTAIFLLSVLAARSQVSITGVTDKSIYTTPPTVLVTSQAGYTSSATLDGVPFELGTPAVVTAVDYHELQTVSTNTSTLAVTTRLLRFVVGDPERLGTETGLPAWTPYPLIASAEEEFAGATLRVIVPASYPQGMDIPVVAWVEKGGHAVRVNGAIAAAGQNSISLLRGVGSGFLSATNPAGPMAYSPAIGGLTQAKIINIESSTQWQGVSGTLAGSITWAADSRIAVTNHLMLAAGAQLTIEAGAVVRVSPGINITNDAAVVINGTLERPVIFSGLSANQPWGGFLMWNGLGSVTGTGAIFTGSGANPNWFGSGGNPSSHRKEQALFFCNGPNRIDLTDSAAIYLSGQLGHAVNGGTFTFTRFLMQRASTGGEYSGPSQPLRFVVNDSAFIECPADTPVFVDGDNDALYLVHGTHGFTNTLFGFTKDDGIDCGGSGAGVLHLVDCWFESIFHEGTSLSGTGKIVNHSRNTLLNNGQGIESGYDAPTANVSGCLLLANATGLRMGDNYTSGYTQNGFLNASNNIVLHNHRDVWGMSFLDWTYRSNQMNVTLNLLSRPDPRWPANALWAPEQDAGLLAGFGNFPPESKVGIGFALRTNRFELRDLDLGLPVRLSRFSTNHVKVQYELESLAGLLAQGSLQFEPGETLKKVFIEIQEPVNHEVLSLRLLNPQQADVTGLGEVFRIKDSPATTLIPKGATWKFLASGQNLGSGWVSPTFPDDTWPSGAAQFGFGDGDETTLVSSNAQVTTYFRHTFKVEDPNMFQSLTVGLLRDDGGVVYLNGLEVFRSNITNGVPLSYLGLATNALPADETITFYTNIVPAMVLIPGTNVCAVEIHQSSVTSSDLSFDLQMYGNPASEFRLKQAKLGSGMLLYWEDKSGQLEEASNLNGPWETVRGYQNPHSVLMTGEQRFYRLRK